MMLDFHNDFKVTRAISPAAAVTNNTSFVSTILDTAGFFSAEFVGVFGGVADSDVTFSFLLEESDSSDMSGANAVASTDLLGVTNMSLNYDSDNKTFKIGYKGAKRYIRATITPSNNTGDVYLAAVWLQANPRKCPQSVQVN